MSRETFFRSNLRGEDNRANYTSAIPGLLLAEPCGQRGSNRSPIPEHTSNISAKQQKSFKEQSFLFQQEKLSFYFGSFIVSLYLASAIDLSLLYYSKSLDKGSVVSH